MSRTFQQKYSSYRQIINRYLDTVIQLPDVAWPPDAVPRQHAEAMRYSLLSGGKRLRPVLLLASYHMFFQDVVPALPFAAAIEMIHAYSLVHDDLPAMDNDSLRRGKPTNHVVFGEAAAILAGDGLLNSAYELMASSDHPGALKAIGEIARRAGSRGMIAGQVADISFEGTAPEENKVLYIHAHKTADMITAPVTAALLLAKANREMLEVGKRYGYHLGVAFQIVDDLLDLKGDETMLGKAARKDAQAGKMTWPHVFGEERARQDAAAHTQAAADSAAAFGEKGVFLQALALDALQRVQ